jgi:hypothetical protein
MNGIMFRRWDLKSYTPSDSNQIKTKSVFSKEKSLEEKQMTAMLTVVVVFGYKTMDYIFLFFLYFPIFQIILNDLVLLLQLLNQSGSQQEINDTGKQG